MVKVGIIGIGGMGRLHFNCYRANPHALIVAICDIDQRKLDGDWSSIGLNVDTSKSDFTDLSGVATYSDWTDLIGAADVQIVDICLPTPLHAKVAIAALLAGKDVLCEKPMAFTSEECTAIEEAQRQSGRKLLVGHCLRYWPEYVKAHEILSSGEYGKVLRASLHRSGGAPIWSWDNWLLDGARSGGAVLDMHIHDVDTALWWFGKPDEIQAAGIVIDGLPASVDALWTYNQGPVIALHGSWDVNGGPFRYAFQIVMERATLSHDLAIGPDLTLYVAGEDPVVVPVVAGLAYQIEIDEMVDSVLNSREITRVTPSSSSVAVATVLEELRQIRPAG